MRVLHQTLISLLTLFSVTVFAQTNEITIRFIGNCGMYFTDGATNFYVDFPYKSGAHNYMEYDSSELDNIKKDAFFIFTHKHSDHYSNKLLKPFDGAKYGPWNIPEIETLNEIIPEFKIKAFETPHKVFGVSFAHYSYLIIWHGKKIFISGDTGSTETISGIKEIDWAFVPAWLLSNAVESNMEIDAEKIAIYHIGPNDKVETTSPEKYLLLNQNGQIITIPF